MMPVSGRLGLIRHSARRLSKTENGNAYVHLEFHPLEDEDDDELPELEEQVGDNNDDGSNII
jgi:hypothetical protein